MQSVNLLRVQYREAQSQADGYSESVCISQRLAHHHPPQIYIYDDGERVHVQVMHRDAEPEHHIYDFGDPAILRTLDNYYGAGDSGNSTL
ncbi:MAG TPA: hypothetical protein VE377_08380 [Candidatus Dormibacteraeota bacterium]|nr:hypothetical protein [Candidatus Dormibacteraeota bacterium]